MSEQKNSTRVQIIVAIIGLAGVLSTGLFGYLSSRPADLPVEDPNSRTTGLVSPPNGSPTNDQNVTNNTDPIAADTIDPTDEQPGDHSDTEQDRTPATILEGPVVPIVPIIEYDVQKFGGGSLRIGHSTDDATMIVSDLTFHWDYSECPALQEPMSGTVMIPYEFEVTVTKERGSKLLSGDEYKITPDELDAFSIDVNYPPGNGIYKMWMEFNYRTFGSSEIEHYITDESYVELCTR